MNQLTLPENLNYVGLFLTFDCQLKCPYCINRYGGLHRPEYELTGDEWIDAINRIDTKETLPGSLQGGEPTQHPDFYKILNATEGPYDLLTNGLFGLEKFLDNTTPDMFRESPGRETGLWFASVRISYHVRDWDIDNQLGYENNLVNVAETLQRNGYLVGFTCPDHPDYQDRINAFEKRAHGNSLRFQRKEFLGYYKGELHGTFKYPSGLSRKPQSCRCKTTELLIDPRGDVYRCHSDLYGSWISPSKITHNTRCARSVGNILHENFDIKDDWRSCDLFGFCNPCDLKLKGNRYGEPGHCSVDVRNVKHDFAPTGGGAMQSTCSMSVGG